MTIEESSIIIDERLLKITVESAMGFKSNFTNSKEVEK